MDKTVKAKPKYVGALLSFEELSGDKSERWKSHYKALVEAGLFDVIERAVKVGGIPSVKRARSGAACAVSVYHNKRLYEKWMQSADDAIPILAAFDALLDEIGAVPASFSPSSVGASEKLFEGA